MRCEVCGMDYGLSHSCSGIGPPLTAEEQAAPPPSIAAGYYLRLAFDIARWDNVAIRRAARDPDSLFYGAVLCAVTSAIIFLGTALPRILRDSAVNAGKLFWQVLLGLLFVWLSMGLIAIAQVVFCHLIGKWFLGARGTFVGITRPLLLGWFVNCLILIPFAGPFAAAIAWTAVMARVFEEADGIARTQAWFISGGINAIFLALQYLLPH